MTELLWRWHYSFTTKLLIRASNQSLSSFCSRMWNTEKCLEMLENGFEILYFPFVAKFPNIDRDNIFYFSFIIQNFCISADGFVALMCTPCRNLLFTSESFMFFL